MSFTEFSADGAQNVGLWSKQESVFEDLVLDAGAGFIALMVGGALAFLFGGMSFIQPWLLFISIGLFWAGFKRGGIPGNQWAKAAAMNAFQWSLLLTLLRGEWWAKPVGLLLTFAAALAGVFTRRFRDRRKPLR